MVLQCNENLTNLQKLQSSLLNSILTFCHYFKWQWTVMWLSQLTAIIRSYQMMWYFPLLSYFLLGKLCFGFPFQHNSIFETNNEKYERLHLLCPNYHPPRFSSLAFSASFQPSCHHLSFGRLSFIFFHSWKLKISLISIQKPKSKTPR